MPVFRKLQSLLRPKNIWMCTKVIIKLYVAFYVVRDMILHSKRVPQYLRPFASAVVSYANNYAEHAKFSRSLSPNDDNAKRARKRMDQVQTYKKLLRLAEEDKILAKENSFDVQDEFDEFGNHFGSKSLRLPPHMSQSQKQKRMLLQVKHDCPEGQDWEECLDEIEKSGQVLLENMERLAEMTRSHLIELEAEEPELRLDLELQSAILAQHSLSIFECLYILVLFIRNGPKKNHLIFLSSTLCFHFLFIIWMGWRVFVRWSLKGETEFNLGYQIGLSFGETEYKWYGFFVIAFLGRGILALQKTKKDDSNNEDPLKIFQYCLFGEKEKLKRILSKYREFININDKHEGNTALHLAILGNHLHIVQLLLYTFKAELESSEKNDEGFNPLDLSIVRKHSNIANTLLRDRYADPQLSSLILAVETDQARIVRHLSQKLDILQGDLVDLVEPLARFCDQTIELKRKDIQKNHRLLLQRQIEKCKNLIISRLKNYHDHQ